MRLSCHRNGRSQSIFLGGMIGTIDRFVLNPQEAQVTFNLYHEILGISKSRITVLQSALVSTVFVLCHSSYIGSEYLSFFDFADQK